MNRNWVSFGMLVFSVFLFLPSASAASGAEAESNERSRSAERRSGDRLEAREHFHRGIRLYSAERYEEALEAFTAANRLRPSHAYLLDIGRCHARLGNHEEAVHHFEEYLIDAPPVERASVSNLIEASQAALEAERAGEANLADAMVGWSDQTASGDVGDDGEPAADGDSAVDDDLLDLADLASLVSPVEDDACPATPPAEPRPAANDPEPAPVVSLPPEVLKSATDEPEDGDPRAPITREWWFWTAVGTVAAGTVAAVAVAASGDASPSATMSPVDLR